ncbi:MAG TPA: L,D-transpeptidase [Xanthobacteraceae bacterium]|nr:L,D-transpeptidase [Xanthobacteraceae bacterium]
MGAIRNSLVVLCALMLGIAAPRQAGAQGACEQIRQSCLEAGFVAGGVKFGVGILVDCIAPIMQGTAQSPRARRALPQIDPELVAACASLRPAFGRPNGSSQAMLPPPPAGNPSRPAAPGVPDVQDQRRIIASLPADEQPETGEVKLAPQFRRTTVDYATKEPAGTIVIDTPNTYLYLVLGKGKALRYGIGVGREGFTWSGTEKISRMAEWPDWYPPAEMIERQPYLPRFMAGGESNPLGARALYLGDTLYRIHGTNQPSTIGSFVSSGCIRLTNEDITDLYGRVQVGTRVVVLPGKSPDAQTPASASR